MKYYQKIIIEMIELIELWYSKISSNIKSNNNNRIQELCDKK